MTVTRSHSIPRFGLPYTPADFAAALAAAFRGGCEPSFSLLGDSPKFWTRSGRQALRLLLGALNLTPRSGVALPLFTDPSLVSAVVAAGHRPVFIDIDPQFLTIDPQSLRAARGSFSALVAVHLFGQLADMSALAEAADGVPIIEDAAHAPLSYLNGRMAGHFGVAAFFSFASTKYWPAGGGGLAVVHDTAVAQRLQDATRALRPPSRLQELRNLALQASKALVFSRPFYGYFGRPLRRWAEKWALLEPCLDLKSIQRSYSAVACRQALRLPARVERQRANSLRLLARLGQLEGAVLPHERPGARYNYHMFPVILRDAAERTAMMDAMWGRFVDTSKIYSGVVDECRRFGYEGGCPVAESVAGRLITLPNHAALANEDIDAVAEAFLGSLQSYRKTVPRQASQSFVRYRDALPVDLSRLPTQAGQQGPQK